MMIDGKDWAEEKSDGSCDDDTEQFNAMLMQCWCNAGHDSDHAENASNGGWQEMNKNV